MSFFKELKRRNVFRIAIGYVVSSWLILQVADLVLENIASPGWVIQTIMLVLALGFPIVVFFSWAFEVTPDGIKRESEIHRSQSILNDNKIFWSHPRLQTLLEKLNTDDVSVAATKAAVASQ